MFDFIRNRFWPEKLNTEKLYNKLIRKYIDIGKCYDFITYCGIEIRSDTFVDGNRISIEIVHNYNINEIIFKPCLLSSHKNRLTSDLKYLSIEEWCKFIADNSEDFIKALKEINIKLQEKNNCYLRNMESKQDCKKKCNLTLLKLIKR